MTENRPIKVAVIGGGCAAMAAAFELTRPQHGGRYEVTVYQQGWRLGGKGASGRGPDGRIEEHGLHLWMGFYENAFRLMRECYEELDRPRTRPDCPILTWRDAFKEAPWIGVTDRLPGGEWEPWLGLLPPNPGLPGDSDTEPWTTTRYLQRTLTLLRTLFETIQARQLGVERRSARPAAPRMSGDEMATAFRRMVDYGQLATLAGLIEAVHLLELGIGPLARFPENFLLRFIDTLSRNAREVLESRLDQDLEVKRVWQVIDLTLATIRGELRDGILTHPDGFDVIDDWDCREWLIDNGASPSSVECGFVRGLYDLGFSYEDGDPARPRVSAGQALRSMVRAFFTYRGSFFWRMQAGMGDIVFAPFYEVLRRRGVRFEFFHRLENVQLAEASRLALDEKPYVEALHFDVQAECRNGEYEPLVDVHGLPCWPAWPKYEQLVDGERLAAEGVDFESHWETRSVGAKKLEVTRDFDFVVLGVGLGAVPHVCRELVERDADWRMMVTHVKTVATQAFQIWLKEDMRDLGWHGPAANISGFVEPFDTWADMRHLLPAEDWPEMPRALAYFCNVLPELPLAARRGEPGYLEAHRELVRRNAVTFLNQHIAHLWPAAVVAPGRFRWDTLQVATPFRDKLDAARGEERFASQFWTANVNPTDRYALSLPGTAKYRISPLNDRYDNLTIAGDWTACGFNAGCVEAATMSGRLAAHALSQSPPLREIAGYDHP